MGLRDFDFANANNKDSISIFLFFCNIVGLQFSRDLCKKSPYAFVVVSLEFEMKSSITF